jgi:hypothetical protein
MKVTERRDVKAHRVQGSKDVLAAEREVAFRDGETARRASADQKTARLKALRLASAAPAKKPGKPAK